MAVVDITATVDITAAADTGRGYYGRGYYNDNAGAIIGGLAAGAIIGGIIASQPRVYSGGGHTSWCYSRYRSYRAYDNTFQPYNGPRRQCYSPYQ